MIKYLTALYILLASTSVNSGVFSTPGYETEDGETKTAEYETLEGDRKLACEMVMCLAAGERPDECDEPLKKYFKMKVKKKFGGIHKGKTRKKRREFLELCPKQDGASSWKEETAETDKPGEEETADASDDIEDASLLEESEETEDSTEAETAEVVSEEQRTLATEVGITQEQLNEYSASGGVALEQSDIDNYQNSVNTSVQVISDSRTDSEEEGATD